MSKSMKIGGGGRFAKGKMALQKKGMSSHEAGAIMAKEGRAKYGKKKMTKWASAGKKRASKS